jgi:hypothetical protein
LNINSNVFVKCAVGDAGLSVRFWNLRNLRAGFVYSAQKCFILFVFRLNLWFIESFQKHSFWQVKGFSTKWLLIPMNFLWNLLRRIWFVCAYFRLHYYHTTSHYITFLFWCGSEYNFYYDLFWWRYFTKVLRLIERYRCSILHDEVWTPIKTSRRTPACFPSNAF